MDKSHIICILSDEHRGAGHMPEQEPAIGLSSLVDLMPSTLGASSVAKSTSGARAEPSRRFFAAMILTDPLVC